MNDSYFTTSSNTTLTSSDSAALAGIMISIIIFVLIFFIIFYVFTAICLGRILKKAGKESWPAWVPFYNSWVLFELGDQNGAYILFQFVPFVGNLIFMVFQFIAMYNIGLKLGKTGIFILWGILLSPVWYAWLAFDDSKWNNNATQTPTNTTKPIATTS